MRVKSTNIVSPFCRTIALLAAISAISLTFRANPALAAPQDAKIFAVYEIAFNGIDLGKFKFWSSQTAKHYAMQANAKFTILNGLLFKWKGATQSSGALTSQGPRPASFSYRSDANGKTDTLKMKFSNNEIRKIVTKPRKKPSRKKVPVLQEHLQNVMDPMSALLVLSESSGKKIPGQQVCNRKIPVFDGLQRFDLTLSYKKKVQLTKAANNGFSGPAYVCKVKYKPIAGHKPSKSATKYMAASNEIEVWLLPIHKAKLYIPYKIVLPTIAGYATATTTVFQIDRPGFKRIAFAE